MVVKIVETVLYTPHDVAVSIYKYDPKTNGFDDDDLPF